MSALHGFGAASVWWDRWSVSFCDGIRWHVAMAPDGENWVGFYSRRVAVVDDFGNLVIV